MRGPLPRWTAPGPPLPRRLPTGAAARRHRFLPDRAPRPLGRGPARAVRLWLRCRTKPARNRRRLAGPGLAAAGAARPPPTEDPTPAAAGERQGGHRRRPRLREPEAALRGGGGIQLPPVGLPEGLPDGRRPQEHLAGERGAAVVRGDPILLLHYQ